MLLLIGLGNPGKEYELSRHNAGFMAIDRIAKYFNFDVFKFNKKFNASVSAGNINGKRTILLKPQTFMNASGSSVRSAMDFYKITTEDIIIMQDELDINIGEYKISRDRSSAGHKGVQSIINSLGTKDFTRYRIGIDSDRTDMASDGFVLANFSREEIELLNKTLDNICDDIKERA